MSVKLSSLRKLYVEQLKDLYSAESQLVKALPAMAEASSSKELRNVFQDHLKVTREQVQRLEQIFNAMAYSPHGKKCKGMEGLIAEGSDLLEKRAEIDSDVLDAGLIAAAQRVEHYEIAAYGTVVTFARILDDKDAARMLEESLDEEYDADKVLSSLAETTVNMAAV